MAGGTWDPTALPTRPGLYLNFIEAATAQIQGGARGTVAIPLIKYDGTALESTVYTIEKESEAIDLFVGSDASKIDNIKSIQFALQGGAKEVVVYTMPASAAEADYAAMRDVLETYAFNVFTFDLDDANTATQYANTKTWTVNNRNNGKHFMSVLGNDDDTTVPSTKAYDDDYIIDLSNGVEINEKIYTSKNFAPFIAGLVAGTSINKSITYQQLFVDDVNARYKNSDINEALQNGALVLVHDGDKIKIEQGITSSGNKIRAIRARQAVATDVMKTASDSYIGKLDNNEDGQKALLSVITAYLEVLENANVLTDIQVQLDPDNPSVGDSVFILISYREIDSMERIFLNVKV
ncbi:phage tail sheath subtilisin-like domain-containing protein [Longirhabdus pacifica]|uniref:phage tail sheath subtilisin-like domain-containing protein n=1 Tax=Longirhabdus pacifica TaxID=2305227 RepID=UPI001008A58F|nr:phage tail sheath subtilisin-like domain-containing protein [Longirhabdus pacifica]